jgi:hypothetical protein
VGGYSDGDLQQQPAEPPRPDRKRAVGVATLVVVFVGLASYGLIYSGVDSPDRPSAPLAAAQAALRPTAAASARSATPVPSPSISSPAPRAVSSHVPNAVAARLLTVASAAAYGPDGTSDGDHPDLAPGIIDGGDGQPWHSSWYASPEFGNLQSGTGLLLDMGETVNLSGVQLVLGTAVGADIQVQVGDAPLPDELSVAASASDVGGTVQLRLNTPVSGRYVLIWFTQLPPISQGKYQATVYSAAVYGTKRTLFVAPGIKSSSKLDAIRSYSITIWS